MSVKDNLANLEWLRKEIIGRNFLFSTPYGKRPLVYADYTASGRGLFFIENYLMHLLKYYANTHTEDDFTGKTMTRLLHEAEKKIKNSVNAGDHGKIIFTGTGATGGITRLQQILGVYWSPATHQRIDSFLESCKRNSKNAKCNHALFEYIKANEPIVFVSPYEHHSNEIMWRQTLCDVVEVPFGHDDKLDLEKLEKMVSDPKYANRDKIGSFSAASNVSGLRTPVYEVARILHRNNAIACFDFAACAPYVEIDMNKDKESYFDAIFLSPHKFLGGPGSSGILVFNEKLYPKDLPPCVAAGGTVDYVSEEEELYIDDIETREKPGTPGIIQAIKTSLVFQLKDKIGSDRIEEIEAFYLRKFYEKFEKETKIVFYGPRKPEDKINIIPFNIRFKDRYLHPKFVTKLLNDLFGVQTRAGCSCAGPYGHKLLNIDTQTSLKYNDFLKEKHYGGIKPGWVRLNIHYTFSQEEFDYIVNAIKFVIKHGYKFLPYYRFCLKTGEWTNLEDKGHPREVALEIDTVRGLDTYKQDEYNHDSPDYKKIMESNHEIVSKLEKDLDFIKFESDLEKLMFFHVCNLQKVQEKFEN